eukprot:TRINITY_DN11969_c0_g1_i3.p1 TRINITY_DN11969_c0_g1~~TRINITY_DN11969_c0_g1_i3.p1  ORF type:complete len:433 (-),score=57.90 TRINITY_DN11969_c0_g1_i3:2521-3819(-)
MTKEQQDQEKWLQETLDFINNEDPLVCLPPDIELLEETRHQLQIDLLSPNQIREYHLDEHRECQASNDRSKPRSSRVTRSRASILSSFTNKTGELEIISWNVGTALLESRLNEIRDQISLFKPDIFVLQEVRNSHPIRFENYHEVNSSFWVRMYVRKGIQFSKKQASEFTEDHAVHSVAISVGNSDITGVYVHPKTRPLQLQYFLDNLSPSKPAIVVGDLNVHSLAFGLYELQARNSLGICLDRFLDQSNWAPYAADAPSFCQGKVHSFLDGFLALKTPIAKVDAYQLFAGHKLIRASACIPHSCDESPNDVPTLQCDWKLWAKTMTSHKTDEENWQNYLQRALETQESCSQPSSRPINGTPWWKTGCRKATLKRNQLYRRVQHASGYLEYLFWEKKFKTSKSHAKKVIKQAKEDWNANMLKTCKDIWSSSL